MKAMYSYLDDRLFAYRAWHLKVSAEEEEEDEEDNDDYDDNDFFLYMSRTVNLSFLSLNILRKTVSQSCPLFISIE